MSSTPRLLSIQSHIVYGYVGNKAAVFPLQTMGFDVDSINTVTLSNHPGYVGGVKGRGMDTDCLHDLIDGLSMNNLLNHDVMLTGYTRSKELLDEIKSIVGRIRVNNPSLCYICDPVMGDNDSFYVPEDLCVKYREEILPLATAITPNWFEAQELSGLKIKNFDNVKQACKILHNFGPEICAITGMKIVPSDSNNHNFLTSIISVKSKLDSSIKIYRIDYPAVDGSYSGCGDVFSALVAGCIYKCRNNLSIRNKQLNSHSFYGSILEIVTNAMSALIQLTKDSNSKELKIIESQESYRRVAQDIDEIISIISKKNETTVENENEELLPQSSSYLAAVINDTPIGNEKSSSLPIGIIFDMDGTLTEPGAIDFQAIYRRAQLKPSDGDIMSQVNKMPNDERKDNILRIIYEEEMFGCERMALRPYLSQLIKSAHHSKVRMAIATRNCNDAFIEFIQKAKLSAQDFKPVLHRDSLNGINKPDPLVAQAVLDVWGVDHRSMNDHGHVWFVGDSLDDMACGKDAGCKTCLILTDYNRDLAGKYPGVVDQVVNDLAEFAELVNLKLL
eukprot:gene13316-17839_t